MPPGGLRAIGLMSGTSMDGIDAALVRLTPSARFVPLAERFTPYPPRVRAQLESLIERPESADLRRLGHLHHEIGFLFAEAANHLSGQVGLDGQVDLIASHGQTVAHFPMRQEGALNATLQLGDLDVIAHRTRTTTVGDFRWGHIAAGGEGAPLAPWFLVPLAAHPKRNRVLLNLGGIANLTILPPGGDPSAVWGFDTGPANTLVDVFVRARGRGAFDEGGRLAARGRVSQTWLEALRLDAWFRQPPPKSTGRETFHREWALSKWMGARRLSLEDQLATLIELTAGSVAEAVRTWIDPPPPVIHASGGGVHNRHLMDRLARRLAPLRLDSVESIRLPVDSLEAMGMAVLGVRALGGPCWRLGSVPMSLGRIVPGFNWPALIRKIRRRSRSPGR